MKQELPAIVKASRRLLLCIEEAVSAFPRRHRYSVGADLRRHCMAVALSAQRAWRDRKHQLQRVHELSDAVDEFRLLFQTCDGLQAFRSRGEFEMIARQLTDLGRQVGGWLRKLHTGQNAHEIDARAQRAPILSSHAAPQGATP